MVPQLMFAVMDSLACFYLFWLNIAYIRLTLLVSKNARGILLDESSACFCHNIDRSTHRSLGCSIRHLYAEQQHQTDINVCWRRIRRNNRQPSGIADRSGQKLH